MHPGIFVSRTREKLGRTCDQIGHTLEPWEAFPLKSKSALEVAKNLCTVIYRHGCPKRILSDQGREFVNQVSFTLCILF